LHGFGHVLVGQLADGVGAQRIHYHHGLLLLIDGAHLSLAQPRHDDLLTRNHFAGELDVHRRGLASLDLDRLGGGLIAYEGHR
jgi:hypothetical protein